MPVVRIRHDNRTKRYNIREAPQTTLDNYFNVAVYIHSGRQPRQSLSADDVAVKDVCNNYRGVCKIFLA